MSTASRPAGSPPDTDAPTTDGSADADVDDGEPVPGRSVRSQVDRETDRWKGVSLVALLAGAAGVLAYSPALLLSSVVGIGYAAYVRAATPPEPSLVVVREFDADRPSPGEEVTVTVTLRNEGDRTLWDLRVVDGVPGPLPVVEDVPRRGATLSPGSAVEFEYTVRAKRGHHVFEECLVLARDLAGVTERELHVHTDDELVCTPSANPTREVPLRALTSRFTGRVEIDDGGEGVEFHSTREYRPGDSLSRIDWNRHARTGELATVEFRQERAATVLLVLDLRKRAYLREDDEGLHAADRGVEAASRVFTALLESGDRVGVSALSPRDVWLAPGAGNEHWARARELFGTNPTLSPTVPGGRTPVTLEVRRLRERLPPDAQVVLFTPLCDDTVAHGIRLLDAHGHLVTVLSPDPTADGSPGQRVARVERLARMATLRGNGIRVVDWAPDEPLATAIDRASRRWSS